MKVRYSGDETGDLRSLENSLHGLGGKQQAANSRWITTGAERARCGWRVGILNRPCGTAVILSLAKLGSLGVSRWQVTQREGWCWEHWQVKGIRGPTMLTRAALNGWKPRALWQTCLSLVPWGYINHHDTGLDIQSSWKLFVQPRGISEKPTS